MTVFAAHARPVPRTGDRHPHQLVPGRACTGDWGRGVAANISVKPRSAFGISAITRSIASMPATNGLMAQARARITNITPCEVLLPPGQKETPFSLGETFSGLSARSSVRLFYPGDWGMSGDGEIARIGLITTCALPDPARAICDGQHVLKLSGSRRQKGPT